MSGCQSPATRSVAAPARGRTGRRRRESRRSTIAPCEQGHRHSAGGHDRARAHGAGPRGLRAPPPTSAFPASFRSPAASSRRCTAAGLWTMRQYAGFATAAESNQRYRYLLAQGVNGLSVAFDLPTQMGYDSDHPLAAGEVGRVGVAIDSIEDMATLFDGIPLDQVSTSMTINATAIILLALYVAVAKSQGVAAAQLSGTVQNDILKEYVARGTYIYPPRQSLRIVTDIFALLRARAAELEHDLDQRLSHPRSGIDGGAGGGVHVRGRARLRAGGDRRRPRRQQLRPAAVVLLQRPQRFSRGDRQVPRGAAAVGAHHARPLSARPTRARSSCASTRRRPAAR